MITTTLRISCLSISNPDSNSGSVNLEAVRTLLQWSPGLPISLKAHLSFQEPVWETGT